MRKIRRQYSHVMIPFLLFLAAELIIVCPSYALLNYAGMGNLHCDIPADDHQTEEDRCLICVVKSSMEAVDSSPLTTLTSEKSEVPTLLILTVVPETRSHSIRPPPLL